MSVLIAYIQRQMKMGKRGVLTPMELSHAHLVSSGSEPGSSYSLHPTSD